MQVYILAEHPEKKTKNVYLPHPTTRQVKCVIWLFRANKCSKCKHEAYKLWTKRRILTCYSELPTTRFCTTKCTSQSRHLAIGHDRAWSRRQAPVQHNTAPQAWAIFTGHGYFSFFPRSESLLWVQDLKCLRLMSLQRFKFNMGLCPRVKANMILHGIPT